MNRELYGVRFITDMYAKNVTTTAKSPTLYQLVKIEKNKMEKAIKKAIEGGWDKDKFNMNYEGKVVTGGVVFNSIIILDPLFWQALGKAEGWDEFAGFSIYYLSTWKKKTEVSMKRWKWEMHKFIDHLAEGKDVESFFEELLK